jgi:hypothetical protein
MLENYYPVWQSHNYSFSWQRTMLNMRSAYHAHLLHDCQTMHAVVAVLEGDHTDVTPGNATIHACEYGAGWGVVVQRKQS